MECQHVKGLNITFFFLSKKVKWKKKEIFICTAMDPVSLPCSVMTAPSPEACYGFFYPKRKKWVMLSGWLQTHMHPPFLLHGQTRSIALQGICGSACFSFQSCQFSVRFELQKKELAWKLKGVYRLVWSLIAYCLFMQSICSEKSRKSNIFKRKKNKTIIFRYV